jgi:hypothetical protein
VGHGDYEGEEMSTKVEELYVWDHVGDAIRDWIYENPHAEIISVSQSVIYERDMTFSLIADRERYHIIIVYKEQ